MLSELCSLEEHVLTNVDADTTQQHAFYGKLSVYED